MYSNKKEVENCPSYIYIYIYIYIYKEIISNILKKMLKKYNTVITSKAIEMEIFKIKIKMYAFLYFKETFPLLLTIYNLMLKVF